MKIYIKNLLLIAAVSGYVNAASADVARENEDLARVVHMLEALNPLINEAELQHDEKGRIAFDYEGLRSDLKKIETGIKIKFSQRLTEPRVVRPLQGDYISIKRKSRE